MKKLQGAVLISVTGVIGLSPAASAIGSLRSAPRTRHTQAAIEALAIDGNRIAYDVGSTLGKSNNRVLVWNVRTGKTTTVSGKHTARMDDSSTGSGVFQLAIAGTRVAWLANVGGNSEGDDYLFTSSVTKPRERRLATVMRIGDNCPGRSANCAGQWLGGLVGSGSLIALNEWTTDDTGSITDGGLYVLSGPMLKSVATGLLTVEAASAEGGRVAAFQPGSDVNVYTSAGKFLEAVSAGRPQAAALSGNNLAVLTATRQLKIWDLRTGVLGKALDVRASAKQPAGNLDVQGNIAIYTTGPSLHAINLSSGKDRVVGKLGGSVGLARISSAGVVYSNSRFASKGTLVFVPIARVSATVS